jgi:hypothetical protein
MFFLFLLLVAFLLTLRIVMHFVTREAANEDIVAADEFPSFMKYLIDKGDFSLELVCNVGETSLL